MNPHLPHESLHPRLLSLLGGDALALLRKKLRQGFERNPERSTLTLRLDQFDATAQEALYQLSGQKRRAVQTLTLDIAQLDEALRAAGLADSLRDALERLDGPIVSAAQRKAALQMRWENAIAQVDACALLRDWLATDAALSRLKRMSDPDRAPTLLAEADRVLRALPAQGQPRAQLAAQQLGDAHALDNTRPLARLVLAVWRHHEQQRNPSAALDDDEEEDQPSQDGQERQRDVWARAGILVNELARPALFLNLPLAEAESPLARPGEPSYISLRQLVRSPPAWAVNGRIVYLSENPNVLAIAANRLGARCAPLMCTEGMPAAAQRILLDRLHDAGAQLRYHGDFDWPGIRIANFVLRRWRALPWRMGSRDYESAVRSATGLLHTLSGAPVDADWDPLLAIAMQDHGTAIAEEAVTEALLADLSAQ